MSHHLSILIPSHNRSHDLRITLEQMTELAIGSFTFEVLVIDNNSSDDTRALVAGFAERLPVRWISQPNPGKNRALNLALDEAQLGDILVFTDDDVSPDPGWLQAIVDTCDRWPDHSVFGGKIEIAWPRTDLPSWASDPAIRSFAFSDHDYAAEECVYQGRHVPFGPNYWLRREVLADGRRFNEHIGPRPDNRILGDETLFLRKLLQDGHRIVYTPHAIVGHRIQPEILTRKGIFERAHMFGRTVPHLLGIPNRELLERSRWRWWLQRYALLCRDRLRHLAVLILSSPSDRIPRVVRRLRDISHHREAMRLVRQSVQRKDPVVSREPEHIVS